MLRQYANNFLTPRRRYPNFCVRNAPWDAWGLCSFQQCKQSYNNKSLKGELGYGCWYKYLTIWAIRSGQIIGSDFSRWDSRQSMQACRPAFGGMGHIDPVF